MNSETTVTVNADTADVQLKLQTIEESLKRIAGLSRKAGLVSPHRFATVQAAAQSSIGATILAIVTSLGGLAVGIGVIGANQQGFIIAATSSGMVVAGLIANAVHTGKIEPSPLIMTIGTFVAQVVALLVSFAWIGEGTAARVIAITTAVVLAAVQIAHAYLSKQVA